MKLYKRQRGTNKYKKQGTFLDARMDTWKTVSWMITLSFILGTVLVIGKYVYDVNIGDYRNFTPPISPLSLVRDQAYAETPENKPETQKQQITDEINQVFGNYAPTALKLLSCENNSLNPQAINDNMKWGGVGKDWGVFQINDKWQGVSNVAFLTDYHINIRMAWNIFSRDGYSFKMWTCGRNMHI